MLGADGGESRRAYVVLHAEPEFDCANPVAARAALEKADLVVVLSAFRTATRYADVLLPIAPFTETSGTFVNCEGRVQSFHGVVQPLGEARPGMEGAARARHDARTAGIRIRHVRSRCATRCWPTPATLAGAARQRDARRRSRRRRAAAAAWSASPTCRSISPIRSCAAPPSLQATADAKPPKARVHRTLLDQLGIEEGAQVKIRQGRGEAVLATQVDPRRAAGRRARRRRASVDVRPRRPVRPGHRGARMTARWMRLLAAGAGR